MRRLRRLCYPVASPPWRAARATAPRPLLVASLALALLVSCAPPAAAPAPPAGAAKPAAVALQKLRVTQSTADSVSFIPIYVARYFNYFGDEGLAVDVVTTGGGGPDVAALIAGEAQFTAAGPINQLALLQEGKRTLAVAGFLDTLTSNIVVHRDVWAEKGLTDASPIEQRLAALRGLKIAVTRVGALTDMVARSYARRAGLDPERDIQIVATGAGQPQMAALEQRQVDAASLTTPSAEVLVERGAGVMLLNNTRGEDPFFKPFTQHAILVREEYARQSPETVRAFARAIVKANQWIREHSAEEAAAIMHFYVPALTQEDIAKNFAYTREAVPADGCLSERGILGNVELFRAAGLLRQDIKWTDLATNEFLPTRC